MTYSESAEGVIVTRARALLELQRHGVFRAEDIAEFLFDCGDLESYDAGDVLRWLGY
ncbi:hypothetical protein [Paracoccus sp. IB05]|uniref:hypothetical protein n=1 Tax=Paracoccus sp. IB05 TaxID=2779367 RepID=UPI0018E8094F|nr:hypothetical protein [Paracoccus sp. IB05]MBJ2153179.1 hypothetical protein [Paracoccus sp. IB05]